MASVQVFVGKRVYGNYWSMLEGEEEKEPALGLASVWIGPLPDPLSSLMQQGKESAKSWDSQPLCNCIYLKELFCGSNEKKKNCVKYVTVPGT